MPLASQLVADFYLLQFRFKNLGFVKATADRWEVHHNHWQTIYASERLVQSDNVTDLRSPTFRGKQSITICRQLYDKLRTWVALTQELSSHK